VTEWPTGKQGHQRDEKQGVNCSSDPTQPPHLRGTGEHMESTIAPRNGHRKDTKNPGYRFGDGNDLVKPGNKAVKKVVGGRLGGKKALD